MDSNFSVIHALKLETIANNAHDQDVTRSHAGYQCPLSGMRGPTHPLTKLNKNCIPGRESLGEHARTGLHNILRVL